MKTVKSPQMQTGVVISSGMEKSIVVKIERVVPHPVYGKYIRRTSKIIVHDADNVAVKGDVVTVAACKPISKKKVWVLSKVHSD